MQNTRPHTIERLADQVREIWRPIVPSIDFTLARILGYAARMPAFTPYRIAKELGLSYSTAYVKIRQAAEKRLVLPASNSKYTITVKGCIAGMAFNVMDTPVFIDCIYRTWGLNRYDGIGAEDVLSFLALLGRILALRGLDLIRTNICFVEEAAAIVFRHISGNLLASIIVDGHADTILRGVAESLGLDPSVLFRGVRLSLNALQGLIPPTLITENHRVFVFVRGGNFIPIAIECRLRCDQFSRSFGVGCARLHHEVATRLLDIAMSRTGREARIA